MGRGQRHKAVVSGAKARASSRRNPLYQPRPTASGPAVPPEASEPAVPSWASDPALPLLCEPSQDEAKSGADIKLVAPDGRHFYLSVLGEVRRDCGDKRGVDRWHLFDKKLQSELAVMLADKHLVHGKWTVRDFLDRDKTASDLKANQLYYADPEQFTWREWGRSADRGEGDPLYEPELLQLRLGLARYLDETTYADWRGARTRTSP